MQEYDIDDPKALAHSWRSHDWTGNEAQFAAQMLQHGDIARAYSRSYADAGSTLKDRRMCLIAGEELMQQPWMVDYIKYVREKIRENMEPTKERILEELSSLAYSNMADFIVIQEDGTYYTDFSNLTREQLAAIQEVTVDTYMDGRGEDAERVKSVKFKLAPKAAALELLGKHNKMWTDVVETSDLTDMASTMQERRRKRQEREAAAQAEQGEATDE